MSIALSGFRLGEQLHASRRSVVQRARRLSDDTPVVLKINGPEVPPEQALARHQHEREILQSLRSDLVIKALDVVRAGPLVALVLEDFGGESLHACLDRERLSLGEALHVALASSRALCEVHEAGIFHRDVNPHNIVYDRVSRALKLIDFDIATASWVGGQRLAAPGAMAGTLAYMAPEQTGRMNRGADQRADLYSLGVTFYQLFTGQLPHDHPDDPVALVHFHLAVTPTAPDRVAALPPVLSDLVMKLLAKAPEDRYQTAAGLRADLQNMVEQQQGRGEIARFRLGTQDHASRFEVSSRLYGRQAEIKTLLQALARASRGGVETVLLSGPSGVGKTSLVMQLHSALAERRGYFLTGKFDQLRRDVPVSALADAFQQLAEQLLGESDQHRDRWRELILRATAPNTRVVIETVPALEPLLGPQPPLPPLDPGGTQNRFNLTWQRFIQVFTCKAHPLVLFLDDLQWADGASLKLLSALATSAETESLLLIEAFRDNDLTGTHLLLDAVNEQERRGVRPVRISLAPLLRAQAAQLLADTLRQDLASVERLAEVVWHKTEGNPFFMRQFLQALHQQGHILFDPATRRFDFNLAAIESAPITENVADLLANKVRQLPPETQRLLPLAAAIGHQFDLHTLATVADRPLTAVHQALEPAMREELITPASELEYGRTSLGSGSGHAVFTRFRFQHDRIQQAAYAAVPVEEQAPLHLVIGRALQAASDPAQLDERIFDIVGNLNRGSALVSDPRERATLAVLNLKAGNRARSSAAHALAATYFRAAAALSTWSDDQATSYQAHQRLAESLYLNSDFAGALQVAEHVARHISSPRERAEVDALRATVHLNMGDLRQSLACFRKAAGALGTEIPEDSQQLPVQLKLAMEQIFQRLGSAAIEDLLQLPVMSDPDKLLLTRLLLNALPAAYMSEATLYALLCAKLVLLSLEHGNGPASAGGYCGLGVVLHTLGQEQEGYRFGRLGVAVADRLPDPALRANALFQFAAFCVPWAEPLAHSVPLMRRSLQLALEGGDYAMAGYSAGLLAMHGLVLGTPLPELLEQTEGQRRLTSELGEVITSRMLGSLCQLMRAYRGELAGRASLDGDGVTEAALVRAAIESGNPTDLFWIHQHRTELRYLAGQHEAARELAEAAEALLPTVPGSMAAPLQRHVHSLVLTALWSEAGEDRRAQWVEKLEANQRQMQHWSELNPANFLPMYLVVEAERARLGLVADDPLDLYDRAIAAAAEQGLLKFEAIANELAGGYWLGRDKRPLALIYLRRARDLYAHWGATQKVQDLEAAHPELALAAHGHPPSDSSIPAAPSDALDLAAVVKASQTISGEILLERLLTAMMEIILRNAGAQGGALLLAGPDGLRIQASRGPQASVTSVMSGLRPADLEWLPDGIVRHVARTGESLVLDDATRHPRFGADPHVRARRPASILCMPIVHKAELQGVLYLENNLISGVFTRARLEALKILVSQLAVSLENASLFARQKQQAEAQVQMNEGLRTEITERQRAERELATYRDRLEELVVARTRELEESREQYRQIVESTKAVPFTYSPAGGRFSYVGPQAEELFGFPAERWKEPDFLAQLLPHDQRERIAGKLASAGLGEQLELEGPACTADRRTLQVRWVVSCGETLGERSLGGLILDVTERRRLESELAQAQKLESVGRLAAGVAHEINTPIQFVSDSLNFVRGAMPDLFQVLKAYQRLPGLLDDVDALKVAAQEAVDAEEDNDLAYIMEYTPGALDRALDGLERVANIVRAMKQFAHPDRKEKSPVDLNQALQSTLTIARNEYKYVADLETHFGDLPPVLCHAGEINQAVLNIVVNAAHAIADAVEGTEQKGKITVRTRRDGDQVEIAISDTGQGIPQEIRQRIFDPFFTTKEVGRGTGQGLAIARNVITDKHGGTLTFVTDPDRGTTFFIRLPVGEREEASAAVTG